MACRHEQRLHIRPTEATIRYDVGGNSQEAEDAAVRGDEIDAG
jgi:hypothetical protein